MKRPAIVCASTAGLDIDGDLGKLDWQRTEAHALVGVADGRPPRHSTTVRFLWSASLLYVGFEVEDSHIQSSFEKRGDPVYREDAVEVFVDPYRFGRTYYEIDVSPNNVVFDALVVNRQQSPDEERDISTLDGWSATGLETATRRVELGWSAEIALPLRELAPPGLPARGDCWSLNAFRVDFEADGGVEFQALSPTGRIDFHRPESFLELMFG